MEKHSHQMIEEVFCKKNINIFSFHLYVKEVTQRCPDGMFVCIKYLETHVQMSSINIKELKCEGYKVDI